MRFVALLRGINVGGNNKVPMADLRKVLSEVGFADVQSYIASGNVLLSVDGMEIKEVQEQFERLLTESFSVNTRVLVIPGERYLQIAAALPVDWQNDDTQKSDVLFLFAEDDSPEILERLVPREGIDRAFYAPGAIFWNVSRTVQTKSALTRVVGTQTYRNLTVRNVNTVRKLQSMLETDRRALAGS